MSTSSYKDDRPSVLLDLDQTLIYGLPTEEYKPEMKEKSKKFNFHDMDGYYIIFERPGLQKLLTFLFDNFNVSVWTAASKDYALFVIKNVILANNKDRKLNYVFFSYHVDISEDKGRGTKDLSSLGKVFQLADFQEAKTFIIDDYDEVHKFQKNNCVLAIPFVFTDKESENDTFCETLLEQLRDLLAKFKNNQNVCSSVDEINSFYKKKM